MLEHADQLTLGEAHAEQLKEQAERSARRVAAGRNKGFYVFDLVVDLVNDVVEGDELRASELEVLAVEDIRVQNVVDVHGLVVAVYREGVGRHLVGARRGRDGEPALYQLLQLLCPHELVVLQCPTRHLTQR